MAEHISGATDGGERSDVSPTANGPRPAEPVLAAVRLAADLLGELTKTDKRLAAVVRDDEAAAFTLALTDEVIRAPDVSTAAELYQRIVGGGVPVALPLIDRVLLRSGAVAARFSPGPTMNLVTRRLRSISSRQVLPATDPVLARRLAAIHRVGARTNVNVLGEAIIGELEAVARRDRIVTMLARRDVDAVSVKIGAIAANLSPLAFDATVARVIDRLRPLYAAAIRGDRRPLITLDMEEYRDLDLTATVFQRVISEPDFRGLRAGIVLQAYLPDSHSMAERLCEFALERIASGGAPIRVRLVKGANLAMEQVEAELRGWPQAPYAQKSDVDASYKSLLDRLLRPELDGAVIVGLASHNLFDIAWGLGLRDRLADRGQRHRLEFEVLEGMAPGLPGAIARRGAVTLVYSPVVDKQSFASAIAYLVRRLDENTSPENFLHALVDLKPGTSRFAAEADKLATSAAARGQVRTQSFRFDRRRRGSPTGTFTNEPDTDFAVTEQRDPIVAAVQAWKPALEPIRPVVAGETTTTEHIVAVIDPSTGANLAVAEMANTALVDRCVAAARRALPAWAQRSHEERRSLLECVAEQFRTARPDLVAVMAHETAKTIGQGDTEVSEAVDFARYYGECTTTLAALDVDGPPSRPLGVVVVAPPWNFPVAIMTGGVCAALAAGNTVIIKPAPQAMLCGQIVAELCWAAGIPREVVQFLPCPDNEVGQHLISHDDVGAVVLTGSIDTARMFLSWKPELCVLAETSGKNTLVVTAAADIDLALKDLVTSAFGHSGQKCSAASLAAFAPCWYDNPAVMARLADAVRSLRCGPASDPATDVPALIGPPSPHLRRALTTLEPGESWLVKPEPLDDAGRAWSPGVRIGVVPGSWFHQTECFGPVLGIMRTATFDDALAAQNAVSFGLTAGLHSLDRAEIVRWCDGVEAGNVYVNRTTTGAIVRRQPFGGWKRSSVGPSAKAGGPHYVLSLRRFEESTPAQSDSAEPDSAVVDRARRSFRHWWSQLYGLELDVSGLRSESNVLRYRPLPSGVVLRLGEGAPTWCSAVAELASSTTGTRLVEISSALDEDDATFARRLAGDRETEGNGGLGLIDADRVRIVGAVGPVVRAAAHARSVTVDDAPITTHGRVELRHWLREQSVTVTQHRHGHVRRSPPN